MFRKIQQIHFIGVGGAGMSGIAEVLLNLGYRVTGSDLQYSETVKRLEALGGKIAIGHHADNLGEAQVVVVSSAVAADNPEVTAARRRAIPVIPRAEMLAELMRLKYGVAIAGAHGKTTTTSLVASVLAEGGLDPTAVIGGKFNTFGSHAKLGSSDLLVAEADESDGSFLKLSPTIAVVTNIDGEHLDHYHDLESVKQHFLQFVNKVPFYGAAIVCVDNDNVRALLPRIEKRMIGYGIEQPADLIACDLEHRAWESDFSVRRGARDLGRFSVKLPGRHNVYNALAAIAVGLELDVGVAPMRKALAEFSGVERRFHLVCERREVAVVDDYGHHPTEIKATLAAARAGWPKRRLVVAFQPHRFTRTRDLLDEFAGAFDQADVLILTEIYPAGERPIEGVTGRALFERVRARGHRQVEFVPERDAVAARVAELMRPGDMVLTVGAGDIYKVGHALAERLAG
jgi:UDP-N-acetylmuramate--alanine ligase